MKNPKTNWKAISGWKNFIFSALIRFEAQALTNNYSSEQSNFYFSSITTRLICRFSLRFSSRCGCGPLITATSLTLNKKTFLFLISRRLRNEAELVEKFALAKLLIN